MYLAFKSGGVTAGDMHAFNTYECICVYMDYTYTYVYMHLYVSIDAPPTHTHTWGSLVISCLLLESI